MNVRTTLIASTLLAAGLTSGAAQAALVDRGSGLVYDTDLNVTWLADANLAATSTFGLATGVDLGPNPGVTNLGPNIIYNNGIMTWGGALKWIAAMNAANYLGYNDWRLPTTTDTGAPGCDVSNNGTDCGYNSMGSEMAHLYYNELGNQGLFSTTDVYQGWGVLKTGPFVNLQSAAYWSGTEYALDATFAWYFDIYWSGGQDAYSKGGTMYAMAVRPGDVAAVPEAQTYALMLAGLGLVGFMGKRRKQVEA